MIKLKKKWKIFVIHHSHTDIGYTDRQEKIEWHHVEYIKEVINILNEAYEKGKDQWKGFKWTCESFWCVEKFLNQASEKEKSDFIKFVKIGNIGLSFNYLNLTDIVAEDILRDVSERTVKELKGLGLETKCAMTADINGYSWGYPQVLNDNGVKFIYSCIHTHHGMFPTGRKQYPFFWETPKGDKILVWNGEHYHIGNELGFSQFASFEYMLKDGLDSKDISFYEKAKVRIYNYLNKFEEEEYPFDFVPITVSALMTDNAPPSFKVIEFINKWNKEFGGEIELTMATIQDLYEKAKVQEKIPTYKGDWTDWWADGVGSTPNVVKHYREAVRTYNICRKLDAENKLGHRDLMEKAQYNLMMYSEHTWGYSASITEPWNTMVNNLDLRKASFASNAHELVARNLDIITSKLGETELKMWHDLKFKVVNPHEVEITDVSKFYLEILFGHDKFLIIDEATGNSLPYQIVRVPRGYEINVQVNLKPKEERMLVFKDLQENRLNAIAGFTDSGSDGVRDIVKNDKESIVTPNRLETSFFRILFEKDTGIVSFYDKELKKELIRHEKKASPFTPLYQFTPLKNNMADDRRVMGRNRSSFYSELDYGKLINSTVLEDGDVFKRVELTYDVKGCSFYRVVLTAYKDIKRVDISCRISKDNVWNAENMYIPLPFTIEDNEEIFIDKAGCIFRPRIDQLPKSCIDFYSIQNAIVLKGKENSLIITTKDAPLIFMGDINAHEIRLCGDVRALNSAPVYSWIMNNFWETNFKASLGGFHEFSYSIFTADSDEVECFNKAKILNEGIIAFNSWK